MVQQIERLRPNRYGHMLPDGEVFHKRKIHVEETWAPEIVACLRSETRGSRSAGRKLRCRQAWHVHGIRAATGKAIGKRRSEDGTAIVEAAQRRGSRRIDHRVRQTGAVEIVARQGPAAEHTVGTPVESGAPQRIGVHPSEADIVPDIQVGVAIVRPDIERILRTENAGIGLQRVERQQAAVRNVVQCVTPRVIQVECQSVRYCAAETYRKAVVIGSARRENLIHHAETGVRHAGRQSYESVGASGGRTVSVHPVIVDGNVNSVHAVVVHAHQRAPPYLMLDFDIPLIVSGLVEGIWKAEDVRRNESAVCSLLNGTQRSTGVKLAQESLVGLRRGIEQTARNPGGDIAVRHGEGGNAGRIERGVFGQESGQFVGEHTRAHTDHGLIVLKRFPGDSDTRFPNHRLRVGKSVALAIDNSLIVGKIRRGACAIEWSRQPREAIVAARRIAIILQSKIER